MGPLVIWLILKKEFPEVDVNGKESLNFQITVTLWYFLAAILAILVIGWFLLFIIAVANVVLVVMAAVKVSNGENFRYPWTIRLIR